MWGNFTRCCNRCYQRRLRAARAAERPACTCASCGTAFVLKRSDAKFCSVACKQRAYRLAHRAEASAALKAGLAVQNRRS